MTVFNSDLDNTLIFSYKHQLGPDKICVEIYQDRKISFVTPRTFSLLKSVNEQTVFVPTTTRSIEQYNRINLGLGQIKYALVCNGGVLLVDGKKDSGWYKSSLDLVGPSLGELKKSIELLEKSPRRKFEIRFIEELFVFTKCENPLLEVSELKKILDPNFVSVHSNGEKIYVVPKNLDKGTAVKRFQKMIGAEKSICAGDSEFDGPMMEVCQVGIVPKDFIHPLENKNILQQKCGGIFSDFVLEKVLSIVNEH